MNRQLAAWALTVLSLLSGCRTPNRGTPSTLSTAASKSLPTSDTDFTSPEVPLTERTRIGAEPNPITASTTKPPKSFQVDQRIELCVAEAEDPTDDLTASSDASNEATLSDVLRDFEGDPDAQQPMTAPVGKPAIAIDDVLPADAYAINLPTVLASVDSSHPVVGVARWRVQESYARLQEANQLWLPTIQAGFSLHRHDGNYQASNGEIVDVNRNSFQYGLGMGATGAGTTNTRPGLVSQFHLADAIFSPRVVTREAWSLRHAATARQNEQMLRAAIAYYDLLAAVQRRAIMAKSKARYETLRRLTQDFAEAGEGLQSDADRLMTETHLIDGRLIAEEESIDVAAADLARAASLPLGSRPWPMDVSMVVLDMSSTDPDPAAMLQTALRNRPELKEAQNLVAAACERLRRERYAPMVPSVLLGLSTGGFGGGLGGDLEDVGSRYDFDALLSWELRQLGLGEKTARRLQSTRVQQARFDKLRVMDQVAAEVTASTRLVHHRRRRIETTRRSIASAEDSHRRNLERIRDGQGLPLEVLQSVEALERSLLAYNDAVRDHNQSQLRLQWALGWPIPSGMPATVTVMNDPVMIEDTMVP